MAVRPEIDSAARATKVAVAADDQAAPPTKSARERILDTASDLFYREGIRAVGIDTIIARSGVAKMSLYRHFASKDDLVVAYLEWRDRAYWEWWDTIVARHAGEPRAQIQALFAGIFARITDRAYRGCAFLNTASEFPTAPNGVAHPAHEVSLAHKEELRRRLLSLSREFGAAEPEILADQLLLLLNGAYSTAPLFAAEWPRTAFDAALETLLDAQLPSGADRRRS